MTRRRFVDGVARWVVFAGGMATILSIVGILGFICIEVQPLWRAPAATPASTFALGDAPLAAAVIDEARNLMVGISAQGAARAAALSDGHAVGDVPIPSLAGRAVAGAARAGKDGVLIATTDGHLVGGRFRFEARQTGAEHLTPPSFVESGVWTLTGDGSAPRLLAGSAPRDDGVVAVFATSEGAPQMLAVSDRRNLFGAVQHSEARHDLPTAVPATATALTVTTDGRRAFVGASNGSVQYWDLSDTAHPVLVDTVDTANRRDVPITTLALLIGDQSVVVGDGAGRVSVWFPVRDSSTETGWRLQRVHVFRPHAGPVRAIVPSPRDKRFLTADATGQVRLHHATSEQTLLDLSAGGPVDALVFAPKANGIAAIGQDGRVSTWDLRNAHPEITLQTLFGKVWYEGYDEPAYVWQSTGGTDDFEPKFSLIPLIIGTVKGTLYAMLFAFPLAVLGALYTSQFAHPRLRGLVKPTVEVMAALPSVVLGFLAGLWLAPAIENVVPGVLTMVIELPLMILAVGALWQFAPAGLRRWLRPGTEVLVLLPLLILGVEVCLWLNGPIERLLFGGSFRAWLQSAGSRFDQRNCLVVGFAMGFAVIPIIFTVSEDALSNVPQRLISASLALGATPWQTALRVVVPTASPGIFSAMMIGFGRAVGETMIVLMATGNTPVLDWSIFTGMRTLSANIAVEVPEAPFGSTLYRVLFLAALLLFFATFLVNTAAELVRLRLRRRYQQL